MQNYFKNKIFEVENNIFLLRAGNIGSLTFYGTNTYLIGKKSLVLIDPGPNDKNHLKNIMNLLSDRPLSHIIITHSHADHFTLAKKISIETNAKIFGFGRGIQKRSDFMNKIIKEKKAFFNNKNFFFNPDILLEDNEKIETNEFTLEVLHTPGHLSDHLCIAIKEKNIIFTGDHVMGWSTSIIIPPDGDIDQYNKSLIKLINRSETTYLPGHGLPIYDGINVSSKYLKHRLLREKEIYNLFLKYDFLTIDQITDNIYRKYDKKLHSFAKQNVFSHLISLIEKEKISYEKKIDICSKFYIK